MKIIRSLITLLTLVATAHAVAAFESVKPDPENAMPRYPLQMTMRGITRGTAVIALTVNPEGMVTDSLVVAYTNELFAKTSLDALRQWRFIPAKLDGVAVPARTEMTFNYTLEGAVVSANIVNHFLFDNFENLGDGYLNYRPCGAGELDRLPVRVAGVSPKYAQDAAKDGVRGKVQVDFYIDETGAVRLPAVATSAHPYLMEKAVEAIRKWKFEPATSRGQPVLVQATQEFNFGEGK